MGGGKRPHRLKRRHPGPAKAVDWEIEHHLAEQVDRLVDAGWAEEAARREAERRFGDLSRQRRRLVLMEAWRMLRSTEAEWRNTAHSVFAHAIRGFARSPGLAAAVVITLGLGIGVNSLMFGLVDRLLLRPPEHVVDPDEVKRVLVHGSLFGTEGTLPVLTYPDVDDLRTIPEFSSVGAISSLRRITLGAGADALRLDVVLATHDLFTTLGVMPRLGRFFGADDDRIGAAGTAVLSEECWERVFGANPDVLGRAVEIDGNPVTIIGVAPRGFTGVDLRPVDMWLPALPSNFAIRGDDGFLTSRGTYWLKAVVRLAEGASGAAVESRVTALHLAGRRDRIEQGRFDPETYVLLAPAVEARGPMASNTSRIALWLLAVSLVVLVIACANVANLLLANGSRMRRETAIRLSLGASRPRLFGEMALGAVLLAGAGGVLALALAIGGGNLVQDRFLPDLLWSDTWLGGRTVVATLLFSVVAGLLSGLGPALQNTRADLADHLKEGGREASHRRSTFRAVLTVTQAALSVMLLVGAGLFLRSVAEVRRLDLGMDIDRLVMAELEFGDRNLAAVERNRFYQDAMARVRRMPGVAGVAATNVSFQSYAVADIRVPGLDSLPIPRGAGPFFYGVTPDYLRVLGLRLLRGRSIEETDLEGTAPVAVVSETMAQALWPGGEALGQCFHFEEQELCTTVVGVVEDASGGEIEEARRLAYYLPLSQVEMAPEALYVRADREARDVAAAIAPVLRSFSSSVRYADVQTLRQVLEPGSRSWALGASLFSAFGLLALLVATIGLYSVLAFDVSQRTKEIGIRSALGARRARLLREVLVRGGLVAAAGCFLGLGAAFLVAPMVQPLLFHVQARDPLILTAVGVTLLVVGCLSSLPPALRAIRVNPVEALGTD